VLVDDAIVVTENVERIMNEEGLSPIDATRKAMKQITGALIAISLVLTAVFVPMAFFGGSVGAIYKQFSLSLVACMGFSIFLAMSLTPALCAHMLPPVEKGHHFEKKGFWGWWNRKFAAGTHRYEGWVGRLVDRTGRYMLLYLGILAVVGWLFIRPPFCRPKTRATSSTASRCRSAQPSNELWPCSSSLSIITSASRKWPT
jgi:multidrug efflux pump